MIETINAVESLHVQLRKIIRIREHFRSDEAAIMHVWLTLRHVLADELPSIFD